MASLACMRGCAIAPRIATTLVARRKAQRRPAHPARVAATAQRPPDREPADTRTLGLLAATAALALAPSHPAHADVLPEIVASFNLATFTPQVFWFAMILAPRNPVVKTVMGSWFPILVATGIHFYVDYVGFTQPGALEEAAKFGAVFDPTIAPWDWANGAVTGPLVGFQSMLENPNFVTEEWAHVLAWDLFVGRWMWLDAVERDVPFLWACLLTTNFTGPPGLLQYFAVCLLSGKGLPPAGAASPFVLNRRRLFARAAADGPGRDRGTRRRRAHHAALGQLRHHRSPVLVRTGHRGGVRRGRGVGRSIALLDADHRPSRRLRAPVGAAGA